LSTTNYADKRI